MKKFLIIFFFLSVLCFGASVSDCRYPVISRGYTIIREHIVSPDSGGEIAVNFGTTKDGHYYSIYVEVDSNGNVIVFDSLLVI